MEIEKTEVEFSAEYLAGALHDYVERNAVYTATGAVDYDRLSEEFGVTHTTLRKAMAGEDFSPRWETWKAIMEKLGKKVVVRE